MARVVNMHRRLGTCLDSDQYVGADIEGFQGVLGESGVTQSALDEFSRLGIVGYTVRPGLSLGADLPCCGGFHQLEEASGSGI